MLNPYIEKLISAEQEAEQIIKKAKDSKYLFD